MPTTVYNPAQLALRFILAQPHPPTTADQVEQCASDYYFNSTRLRAAYRGHKEAGAAIRAEYERAHNPAWVIFNAEEVRAISYTETGQQCTGWLPAGTYQIQRETTISISERGTVTESPAVELLRPSNAGKNDRLWYVHPSAISTLTGNPQTE